MNTYKKGSLAIRTNTFISMSRHLAETNKTLLLQWVLQRKTVKIKIIKQKKSFVLWFVTYQHKQEKKRNNWKVGHTNTREDGYILTRTGIQKDDYCYHGVCYKEMYFLCVCFSFLSSCCLVCVCVCLCLPNHRKREQKMGFKWRGKEERTKRTYHGIKNDYIEAPTIKI